MLGSSLNTLMVLTLPPSPPVIAMTQAQLWSRSSTYASMATTCIERGQRRALPRACCGTPHW